MEEIVIIKSLKKERNWTNYGGYGKRIQNIRYKNWWHLACEKQRIYHHEKVNFNH